MNTQFQPRLMFHIDSYNVFVEHVRRGTTTKKALYSWTDVSLRESTAKTWTEKLPDLSRGVYEDLAKIPQDEPRTAQERQSQELRKRLLEKEETTETTMWAVWV